MARVRLGELLLARGLCTREQLSEAWEQKVVYGDRLGTNLLSLGILDEAALAAALGAQHGVHGGHGGVLHVDPAAVALVPKNVALKRNVVPHHLDKRVLYLLMRDPDDLRAIDDVRFATRLKVQPIVVCEARLWRLLGEHYGQKPPLRPNPLDRAPTAKTTATTTEPKPAVEDLVSEDDFQALYGRLAGRDDSAEAAAPAVVDAAAAATADAPAAVVDAAPAVDDASAPFEGGPSAPPVTEVPEWAEDTRPIRLRLVAGTVVPEVVSDDEAAADESVDVDMSDDDDDAPAPSPLSAPLSADAVAVEADAWQRSLGVTHPRLAVPKIEGSLDEIQLVEVADDDPDSVPPDFGGFGPSSTTNLSMIVPAPDLSPLSFDDAVTLLKTASGRDDIARVVLRAAHARFARACVLTVFPHAIVGWQGVGEGFETEKLVEFSLARDAPSVFSLVADSRAHHLGPLQRFAAHGAWVKATGRKLPKSLAVLPVLVKGRCVNLLVVDNGHDQHVGSDVGELLILSRHIAGTYESLIQKG